MIKTFAIPERLNKPEDELTEAEKTELATFGDQPMTAEEIAEREAEIAANVAAAPLVDWQYKIAEADKKIPRQLEDVIDVLPDDMRAKIAPQTLTAYNAKKELRASKPKGT